MIRDETAKQLKSRIRSRFIEMIKSCNEAVDAGVNCDFIKEDLFPPGADADRNLDALICGIIRGELSKQLKLVSDPSNWGK